ncbi:MAG TPA: membrane dipeptidase [Streptosporangiaceae bacterium]|nr:membrane dipeptidase [Streptosporangiaceae bacterium]
MTTRAPWVDVHAHPGRCFLGTDGLSTALSAAEHAGMAAVTVATVSDLRVLSLDPDLGLRVSREFSPGEAYADHKRQLDGIGEIVASAGHQVAMTAADIDVAHQSARTAVLLSCEGGDFLEGKPDRLAEARAAGVSSLTLVHYRVNDIGDVQTEQPVHGGLTGFGRDVVAECNALGIIIDCAHATFETTADVLAQSTAPVMISHSHLDHTDRHHPRLLSAAHARAVAEAGGLVGAWPSGVTSSSLADFADEVIRLVDLIGVDHVAIGTDMDANFRPVLGSYADFPDLLQLLAARGLGNAETDMVLGTNARDLLGTVAG